MKRLLFLALILLLLLPLPALAEGEAGPAPTAAPEGAITFEPEEGLPLPFHQCPDHYSITQTQIQALHFSALRKNLELLDRKSVV